MQPSATLPHEIYQLKISLLGISPMIWRRLLVHSGSSIADLHHFIQIAMGWEDIRIASSFMLKSMASSALVAFGLTQTLIVSSQTQYQNQERAHLDAISPKQRKN